MCEATAHQVLQAEAGCGVGFSTKGQDMRKATLVALGLVLIAAAPAFAKGGGGPGGGPGGGLGGGAGAVVRGPAGPQFRGGPSFSGPQFHQRFFGHPLRTTVPDRVFPHRFFHHGFASGCGRRWRVDSTIGKRDRMHWPLFMAP